MWMVLSRLSAADFTLIGELDGVLIALISSTPLQSSALVTRLDTGMSDEQSRRFAKFGACLLMVPSSAVSESGHIMGSHHLTVRGGVIGAALAKENLQLLHYKIENRPEWVNCADAGALHSKMSGAATSEFGRAVKYHFIDAAAAGAAQPDRWFWRRDESGGTTACLRDWAPGNARDIAALRLSAPLRS